MIHGFTYVISVFLGMSSLFLVSACKTSGNDEKIEESAVQNVSQGPRNIDQFKGISTEHYFSKIDQTHCGINQKGLRQLAALGYHYIAVSQEFFDKYDGKACGKVFEITVGGACYQSSDLSCLKEHAPLEKIGSGNFKGQRTAKFVVADLCPECQSVLENGVKHFHIDILNTVYSKSVLGSKTASPLEELRTYLAKNMQTAKAPNGRAYHENNLYLSQVKALNDCVSLKRMTTEIKGGLPADAKFWLPNRYCE